MLVKEVLAGEHGRMTTGQANWASDATKVWFVMIKDAKGRYPGNPLWGDGWAWALFKGDAPDKHVATDYRKDCLERLHRAISTSRRFAEAAYARPARVGPVPDTQPHPATEPNLRRHNQLRVLISTATWAPVEIASAFA